MSRMTGMNQSLHTAAGHPAAPPQSAGFLVMAARPGGAGVMRASDRRIRFRVAIALMPATSMPVEGRPGWDHFPARRMDFPGWRTP